MYVGSGEANTRGNVALGSGIFRSTDAGRSWQHVWKGRGQIGTMTVHPQNADVAFAAAAGQREVGRLFGQRRFEFQFAAAPGQGSFQLNLGGINGFAGGRFLFLGQRPELLHQRGELAVRSDPSALGLFQPGKVGRGLEFRQRG